ncbi:MAG TPA: MBL fold metallo-hydrolase [Gemmatimonadales bacterium]|nr:MBL fold metallo-hydrolase [Gemmatimonadales bacterium]
MPLAERLAFARRYALNAVVHRRGDFVRCVAPAPHRPDPTGWPNDRLTASWLGHATVLLNFHGTTILTDPVLERRIGLGRGFAKIGPRRHIHPALRKRELPGLDAVLLSHAHMDHTDLGTLRAIPASVPVVVQSGNRDLVRRFHAVDELAWGESTRIGDLEIESVETRHWGARMVTDRHRGWGGYLLRKGGRTVLFGGDTAYTDAFTILRERGPVDLAILPIGAYDPWVTSHASPEESWRMFTALGATYLLPIHHATFRLSREPMDEPIRRLLAAAGTERWRVVITEVGQTWSMPSGRGSAVA